MFKPAADDGVKDGAFAMRQLVDANHVVICAFAVVLRNSPKGPSRTRICEDFALKDYFSRGRYPDVAVDARCDPSGAPPRAPAPSSS